MGALMRLSEVIEDLDLWGMAADANRLRSIYVEIRERLEACEAPRKEQDETWKTMLTTYTLGRLEAEGITTRGGFVAHFNRPRPMVVHGLGKKSMNECIRVVELLARAA